MPFQAQAQTDFSGGVNAIASPYSLGNKQVLRARNLILDEQGSLRTRDGYAVVTTSPDTTNPLLYLGTLNKSDLSSTRFAIQFGSATNRLYRSSDTPWTTIGDFGTNYELPDSVTINNVAVIAAGYEIPKRYDGNTLAAITAGAGQTVPPGAKHLAFHLGSLWVWNTSPITTTLDGPSSLRMSDANNPNSWPNANQTFLGKDDGQVGMGLATFTIAETGISPTQTLVCFKNFSAYQIIGVFGAANFSVQRIKSDMGCIAPRTIQFVSGMGIIRLTHKGFALFNGVDDALISEEVRPFIFGQDDIVGLNQSAVERSWASQSQNPPLYIAACPVGGDRLTRIFVYDLIRRAWSICDFPVPFQCLNLLGSATQFPRVFAGLSTGGQVIKIFDRDTSDASAKIPWSVRTKKFTAGSALRPTFWRRVAADIVFEPPSQAINFTVTFTGLSADKTGGNTLAATRTLTGTSTGAKWGTAVWGQFNWAGTDAVDGRLEMDVMKTAPSAQLELGGTGNVRIRSLEWHTMGKSPTSVKRYGA